MRTVMRHEATGKRKFICSIFGGLLFLLYVPAEAQQPTEIPRVGILFIGGRDQPHLQSFKQGLQERGYAEGKNIKLEYKYAEGKQERLYELALEVAREQVDVLRT